MKSILVIGIGKFGLILSKKMLDLGNNVMIVDKDEEKINELSTDYTNSLIGDCTNISVLKSIGINNFDICFVTIGNDFQASLEVTSQLKELGAKYVISKADRDIQAKFLLKNGADEIVYPERDIATKLAIKCNSDNIFDLIELSSDFGIFEISTPSKWHGYSLKEKNVRIKYKINVLATKRGNKLNPLPDTEHIFNENEHLIVLGKTNDVFKLIAATKKY